MKETLRHSVGAAGRSPRTCPDETLHFTDCTVSPPKKYTLPPGVTISMTTYQTITNPAIYPDPYAFNPDRWLTRDADQLARLDRYLTVFSGGARACLGMWLAQAEITLTLAKLWRVWGAQGDRRAGDVGAMKLFGTTARDVRMAADYFIPIPWRGTKGVRVLLESF